jgi:hypothetical protein
MYHTGTKQEYGTMKQAVWQLATRDVDSGQRVASAKREHHPQALRVMFLLPRVIIFRHNNAAIPSNMGASLSLNAAALCATSTLHTTTDRLLFFGGGDSNG